MRKRKRIIENLEDLYRRAFESAEAADDKEGMARLDFDFQRDQLYLEVMLDLRELLVTPEPEEEAPSLLEKAEKLRRLKRLTRLRP